MSYGVARTESSLPLSVSPAPGTVPNRLWILNKQVLKEGRGQEDREGEREIRREKGNKMWREGIEN